MESVPQLETLVLTEFMTSGLAIGFAIVTLGGFTAYVIGQIAKIFESV